MIEQIHDSVHVSVYGLLQIHNCMDFYFVLFPFWKSSFQVQKASTSLFCCLLYIWMLISLYYRYSNVDFILLSCEGWH
ncbi:hypothetical protein RchiOBHm_Chr2g0132481 [Rosa chinensis]|uniref:Uncharacterized protein n=1 Tax=Rosa chinensis TaxID=74649 RepID=A0A2P6RVC5_ROSCH|nr:hypothetical protein RchiOBHm_Chr2g0132481 [Rosa chinensis]